jgi:hypothetical protein
MAKQVINVGASANDGTGDRLRKAFEKTNDNFDELYNTTDFANNSTTVALTASDLNTAYPTAQQGFRVFALNIIAGALVYTKTATGWISNIVTIVV